MATPSATAMFGSRWSPSPPRPQPQQQQQQFNNSNNNNNNSQSTPAASSLRQQGGAAIPAYSAPSALSVGSGSAASDNAPRSSRGSRKAEPLIVFDWDDTMLASSWIQVRELLQAGSYEDLPSEARRDLAHLEQSVIKCLTNARGLGTVIIITNAESGWVELSAARFFVNLLPLLEGVPVVSARSLFEEQFPGSPLCWKSAAFAYMMHDHFLDRPGLTEKKVVSIGDSNEEKVAMRIASGQHATMAAKAVKFITGPDPGALACQLDFVTHHLESVVSSDGDVDIVLDATMIKGHRCHLLRSRGVYNDHQQQQQQQQPTITAAAANPNPPPYLPPAVSNEQQSIAMARGSHEEGNRGTSATAATAPPTPTAINILEFPDVSSTVAPSSSIQQQHTPISTNDTSSSRSSKRPSSNPIPIPLGQGQGRKGGVGGSGGICGQPFPPPSKIEVGGCSSASSSSSSSSSSLLFGRRGHGRGYAPPTPATGPTELSTVEEPTTTGEFLSPSDSAYGGGSGGGEDPQRNPGVGALSSGARACPVDGSGDGGGSGCGSDSLAEVKWEEDQVFALEEVVGGLGTGAPGAI